MKNYNLLKNILVLLLVNFFMFNRIVLSQVDNEKKFIGKWNGELNFGSVSLRLIISIEEKGGKLTAKMDSPNQNVNDILIDEIIINENNIKVVVKSIMGSYEGKYSPEKNLIEGNWSQQGQLFPLELKKEVSSAQKTDREKKYTSFWEGKLKISAAISLRLELKVFKNSSGELAAVLISPDQGSQEIQVSSIILSEDSLKFESKMIQGKFTGKIIKDSSIAKGNWKQATLDIPLELKKVEKLTEVNRPQTPKKPFPYNEEEITFENNSAKITLAGTLTYPKGEGKFPAVVLVTGSGPQDRDETLLEHKPFMVIADYLTRNGIVVLRFDDRGTAKSKGSFATATTEDFASDALAAVEYLKLRKEINSKKIGVAGHSEGGLIAPICAVNSNDVSFIVMLAGPGVSGREILLLQAKLISKAQGEKDEDIEKSGKLSQNIYDVVKEFSDNAAAEKKIKELFAEYYKTLNSDEQKKFVEQKPMIEQSTKQILSPWFRFFLNYDPHSTLEQVAVPALALNGEKDLQVPPSQNLPEIEKSFKKAGNKNYKIVELPGLNHLFQHAKTGSPSEYGTIEETFSEDALKIIKDWILEVTK